MNDAKPPTDNDNEPADPTRRELLRQGKHYVAPTMVTLLLADVANAQIGSPPRPPDLGPGGPPPPPSGG